MQLFYLTPFSLSVLNVAIMLTLLSAFLWRIPDKSPATRYKVVGNDSAVTTAATPGGESR